MINIITDLDKSYCTLFYKQCYLAINEKYGKYLP